MKNLFITLSLLAITLPCATAQDILSRADSIAIAQADSIDRATRNLDDFVITVKKDVIKSDGAKLTYDLEQDDSSKGQNLLDALKKVPMVNVDAQDKITINGNSNFKIYVNGKEEQMMEANYSNIFKSMPAESVAKIEVITEPGAKYDAEGVGGIINLVTERSQKRDGYSGAVNGSFGNRQISAGGYISGKIDRFSINANVAYANNGLAPQHSFSDNTTIYKNNDVDHKFITSMNQRIKFNFLMGSIDMGWEPTDRDLFNWGGSIMKMRGSVDKITSTNRMFDAQGNLRYAYGENYNGLLGNIGATGNFSYRHSFNDDNTHRIIAAYMFDFGRNRMNLDVNVIDPVNYSGYHEYRNTDNLSFSREHTMQIDYSNPFGGEKHSLDAGVKGIFRRNSAEGKELQGNDKDDMEPVAGNNLSTAQNVDVYAAYLAYNGSFSKFSLTAGLRYEHTMMHMNFHHENEKNFTNHLNDWVPNAALTWNFGPANNLRLAYQMRITRPSIEQVNPYVTYLTKYMAQTGNPDLSSARSNSVSLTYTKFERILGGNIQLQYSQVDNGITSWTYNRGETVFTSYLNAGHERSVRLSGFLNINISPKMTLAINANTMYKHLAAPTINAANHGWSAGYGVNYNYTMPWDLRLGINGGQNFHDVNLQGYSDGWYYYGLSLSRQLLKNKSLTVGLNAWNFLQDRAHFKSRAETPDMVNKSDWSNKCWGVSLSVSWNFGHLKEQIKKTGLDMTNDDIQSTGNNRGGNTGGISL